jgi:hypothetical protein
VINYAKQDPADGDYRTDCRDCCSHINLRVAARFLGKFLLRSDWQQACRQPVRSVVRKMVGLDSSQVDSVRETVTSREEVTPMNVVTMWVLPLSFTVER